LILGTFIKYFAARPVSIVEMISIHVPQEKQAKQDTIKKS
jgi:hypothetical protein